MKILHLSDTSLSGSPYRLSKLLNKAGVESRHIVYRAKVHDRVFPTDLVGKGMSREQVERWLNWPDIIHFHNHWKKQPLLQGIEIPKKPAVIQIHSPRGSEDFSEVIESGLPVAVIAQFHVREWPEASFIVPNAIDITDPLYMPYEGAKSRLFTIGYSPSSANGKGWNSKSYEVVGRPLKKLKFAGTINFNLVFGKPHVEAMEMKKRSHIGIDEISTGSYHLSGLEFLSMGVPCLCGADQLTTKAIQDVTGSDEMPFILAGRDTFLNAIRKIMIDKNADELGVKARKWMEKYWNPEVVTKRYLDMYGAL